MLNSEGGTLLVGVDDGGQMIGLDDDLRTLGHKVDLDGYELFLREPLETSLSLTTVHLVRMRFHTCGGRDLYEVSVAASGRPVFAKPLKANESDPHAWASWVRLGDQTRTLHGDDMLQ